MRSKCAYMLILPSFELIFERNDGTLRFVSLFVGLALFFYPMNLRWLWGASPANVLGYLATLYGLSLVEG